MRLDLSALRRIFALARPEVRTLVAATAALIVSSGMNLAWPQLIQRIVDGVLAGGGEASVHAWSGLLLVLFAVGAVATALRSWLFTVAGERIVMRLRQALYARLVHQDMAFFDTHRVGELTSRLTADTTVLQNAATVNLSMLLRYLITALGSVGILAWTSWRLTLVMLALVPVTVVGALVYGRIVRRLSRQVQDAQARATVVAEETLAGIRTVRAFAREEAEAGRYRAETEAAYGLARRRARFNAFFGGIAGFAGYGAISGVLWYGGLMLVAGELSLGTLMAFLLYTFTLAFAIAALGELWQDFMRAIGASERVFELLSRTPAVAPGGERLEAVRGEVAFEAVSFAYPSRPGHPVLTALSLRLEPGRVLALVGRSGGGKSTISALISRFYDPDAGAVTLDGVPLTALDPAWLREQVGVVAQEPLLFATSIADNIRYGRPGATDAGGGGGGPGRQRPRLRPGPAGRLRHRGGGAGCSSPGGQRQRIAIARAVLKDPRVLVLDEATSALDAESEHLVQEALTRLMRGRTTLVIAHRLSTVQAADRIVVLDQGRVIEAGTHGELLARGGAYRQLVDRQFALG
ncbi:MAG: ABC transporter transmembrane domain-containing protein [bacterium]